MFRDFVATAKCWACLYGLLLPGVVNWCNHDVRTPVTQCRALSDDDPILVMNAWEKERGGEEYRWEEWKRGRCTRWNALTPTKAKEEGDFLSQDPFGQFGQGVELSKLGNVDTPRLDATSLRRGCTHAHPNKLASSTITASRPSSLLSPSLGQQSHNANTNVVTTHREEASAEPYGSDPIPLLPTPIHRRRVWTCVHIHRLRL